MEFCQVNHQAREDRLAGVVRGSGESAGNIKPPHPSLTLTAAPKTQHIVEGVFHQTHGAGTSGTDNIAARLGHNRCAPFDLQNDTIRPPSSVWNETVVMGFLAHGDADLNLGVRPTMTLTLAITLLGVYLKIRIFLPLAVLSRPWLDLRTSTTGAPRLAFSPSRMPGPCQR